MDEARHTAATLVASVSDGELVAALGRLHYTGQAEEASGYLAVLAKLRAMKPDLTTMCCILSKRENVVDVSGVEMGDPTKWAIEYEPWSRWLGMTVHVEKLPDADILANILYEMTWAGFDEDEIAEQKAEILSAAESIDVTES